MASSKRRAEAFARGTRRVDGAGFFWPTGRARLAGRLYEVWAPVRDALDCAGPIADANHAATHEVTYRWTAR